jgi:hypothetical protein
VVVVVSVVPVVPVDVVPVSVAGLVLELLPVGGFPGRGGSRLVAVAAFVPRVFGATAVEVTAVVVLAAEVVVVLFVLGVAPALPAAIGGGRGETFRVVSVAGAVDVVTTVAVVAV